MVSNKWILYWGEDGIRNAPDLVSRVRHMASRIWPCRGSGKSTVINSISLSIPIQKSSRGSENGNTMGG